MISFRALMGAAALLSALSLAGCGRGKQNAALALDEARLNIAAARTAGAQIYSAESLRIAEKGLAAAEKDFAGARFQKARDAAEKAAKLAAGAQAEAERKSSEKKARKKPAGAG